MPPDVETAFKAAHVSLFPEARQDLTTKSSCPDAVNPCKHLAAVFYLLGERFDGFLPDFWPHDARKDVGRAPRPDPTQGEAAAAPTAVEKLTDGRPLEELIPSFWQEGAPLDHLAVSIVAPEVGALLLKRLRARRRWARKPAT